MTYPITGRRPWAPVPELTPPLACGICGETVDQPLTHASCDSDFCAECWAGVKIRAARSRTACLCPACDLHLGWTPLKQNKELSENADIMAVVACVLCQEPMSRWFGPMHFDRMHSTTVAVKTLNGNSFPLRCHAAEVILDVKTTVAAHLVWPDRSTVDPDDFYFVYNGKMLFHDNYLAHYGIGLDDGDSVAPKTLYILSCVSAMWRGFPTFSKF